MERYTKNGLYGTITQEYSSKGSLYYLKGESTEAEKQILIDGLSIRHNSMTGCLIQVVSKGWRKA